MEETYVFNLKNDIQINVDEFPELNKLGTWLIKVDHNNLRVKTSLDKTRLIKEFMRITHLKPNDFELGVVIGSDSIK